VVHIVTTGLKGLIQGIMCASGWGSVAGTATRYRLNGSGFEPRVGPRFSTSVQPGYQAHPASCKTGTDWGCFPGAKRPGRGVNQPPPSSVEVKERVRYTPMPSWHDIQWNVPFTFYRVWLLLLWFSNFCVYNIQLNYRSPLLPRAAVKD
jgi:hypothetical protein